MTQFGRALSELNIEILCANTSQAKGRVERAHHTLQDRLVKELRLAGISTIERPTLSCPALSPTTTPASPASRKRSGLPPRARSSAGSRSDFVLARATSGLATARGQLQPDEADAQAGGLAVRLRGKMVEVYDFPDGRLEIRWKGRSLPYSAFDKLQRVSHAAIVENKRLGEVLAWIKEQQDQQPRFNTVPKGPRRSSQKPGILKRRAQRIVEAAQSPPNPPAKDGAAPIRWSARRLLPCPEQPPYDISTLHDP